MTPSWTYETMGTLPHTPNGEDDFGVFVYDFATSERLLLFSAPTRRQLLSWVNRIPYDPDAHLVRVEPLREAPAAFRHIYTRKGGMVTVRELGGTEAGR